MCILNSDAFAWEGKVELIRGISVYIYPGQFPLSLIFGWRERKKWGREGKARAFLGGGNTD